MSDTRNHTTRDQLDGTDEFWLCNSSDHVRYSTHDYCLVHETPIPTDDRCPVTVAKLAAVRAAAVAETTATIEAVLAPLEADGDYNPYADIRAALSGGRTALDTALAQARAEGWEARDKARPQYLGPHDGHYEDCAGWHDCYCGTYPNPYRADTGADQ